MKEQTGMLQYGTPSEKQLEKINKFTRRPLMAEDVFAFDAKFVGDAIIPSRFLKISTAVLDEFEKQVQSGIPFMLNHSWGWGTTRDAFVYGRSYDSRLEDSSDIEGETKALYGSIYIPRGREIDGIKTDEIIHQIEDGTMLDVSIGFAISNWVCSICNERFVGSDCNHWPGREYKGELCYLIAEPPGTVFEISAVFQGAYPTAEILSAAIMKDQRWQEQLPIEVINDPDDFRLVKPGTTIHGYVSTATDFLFVEKGAVERKPVVQVQATKEEEEVDEMLTNEEVKAALGSEMPKDQVLQLAREGKQYREELIEEALAWGVRAHGEYFSQDSWREILSEPSRSIEAIKGFIEQFRKEAEKNVPAGRKTDPEAGLVDSTRDAENDSGIPDELFRVD